MAVTQPATLTHDPEDVLDHDADTVYEERWEPGDDGVLIPEFFCVGCEDPKVLVAPTTLKARLDAQYPHLGGWPKEWCSDRENEVLPGLFIGGLEAARAAAGFDLIVTLSGVDRLRPMEHRALIPAQVEVAWPIDDGQAMPDTAALWRIAGIAASVLTSRRDARVLIHCAAGINRSALMTAAVVMLVRSVDGKTAMSMVRAARKGTLGNQTFARWLHGHGVPVARWSGKPKRKNRKP